MTSVYMLYTRNPVSEFIVVPMIIFSKNYSLMISQNFETFFIYQKFFLDMAKSCLDWKPRGDLDTTG